MIDVLINYKYICRENKIHYQDIYIKGHAWKTSDLCKPNYDKIGDRVCSSITSILISLYPYLKDIGEVTLEKGYFEYHCCSKRFKNDDYRLDTLIFTLDYLYHNYREFFNSFELIEIEKEKKDNEN